MGDYPVPALGDRTPLQAASIPHMRRLAADGDIRILKTVPDALPPGSDVANLGLLGYDATVNYTGRAPIEAAGANLPMGEQDIAYRCNLVTLRDGRMDDYSADHIDSDTARQLMEHLDRELGDGRRRFHAGVSYRHLLLWENGPADIRSQPPHDIADQPVDDHLPAGDRAGEVRALMEAARPLLADHPANRAREDQGHKPATDIWLWGQGKALTLPTFPEQYGLTGGVVTAVDLVRGLGVLAGLEVPRVPGATGFVDTNYEGKVEAALDILERHDFVYVHLEAPDECGHLGDAELKTHAIEEFDRRIVGPIRHALEEEGEPFLLAVTMDHRTPIALRGHSREPVPMAVLRGPAPGSGAGEAAFDESLVEQGVAEPSHRVVAELLREHG